MRSLTGDEHSSAQDKREQEVADAAVVQTVLQDLLSRHGIRANYVPALASEAEALKAAQSLPLFYVWGQQETESGASFTFGLNGLLVTGALMAHAEPGTGRFKRLKARIERKLHRAAYDALVAECEALAVTPRDVLDSWSLPPQG